MSLRDWFAGQALAGGAKNLVVCPASQVARLAYEVADAMLEAHKRD
ncbi:MAG: hypothetical protein OXQ29_15845 [Rhodospirillaceae bacterium]|nr:hypothetical protein [Rhodospirillaceae bacterium]